MGSYRSKRALIGQSSCPALAGLLVTLALISQPAVGQAFADAKSQQQQWRRGAKAFHTYCAGCHSLHDVREQQLSTDLGLDESLMHALLGVDQSVDQIWISAMSPDQGQRWFGVAPPDLSLIARVKGAQWLRDYLSGYYPDPQRPTGWNNRIQPQTAMPNPLWDLQLARCRSARVDVLPMPASCQTTQANRQFDQTVADITAFLVYSADPTVVQRRVWRGWVMAGLVIFTVLCALLKREFWEDVR